MDEAALFSIDSVYIRGEDIRHKFQERADADLSKNSRLLSMRASRSNNRNLSKFYSNVPKIFDFDFSSFPKEVPEVDRQ